jgi:hypothetical protein
MGRARAPREPSSHQLEFGDDVPVLRSYCAIVLDHHTVQPELERFCAKRMDATTYEADTSHVAMLSNPSLVIDVIRTAASAVA